MALRSKRFGPAINEKDQFENRTISARNGVPWQNHRGYNQSHLSESAQRKQEVLGSAAFLVFKNDQLIYERYWRPFTQESVINAFSVAKSVVCILIGIAHQKGMLQLEDTVGQYLPAFKVSSKKKITIEHLLMMSSGLEWIESEGHPFSHNAEAYYGSDLTKLVLNLRSKRPAGEVYRYVSGNTQILAMVLQAVTGKTYHNLPKMNYGDRSVPRMMLFGI